MPKLETFDIPDEMVLGVAPNQRVPQGDQRRQREEVEHILQRLQRQPGVILADEVGMGKTFVALAVAYVIACQSRRGPVILMVPANLVDKWIQDLKTFCELYLKDSHPVDRNEASTAELRAENAVRYGAARHSIELMRYLDDLARDRCHLIFLAQGAMARRQSDKWIRLALIREALLRHARGKADRLIKIKKQIHRFTAELIWAIGEERASDWGDDLWHELLRRAPADWMDIYNESVHNSRKRLSDDPVPESVIKALPKIDLKELADSLATMPIRARGGSDRVSNRIAAAREVLREVEADLWKRILAQTRWRSPLLIMDEAHHLKNPSTSLARQLQSTEADGDLKTGDGAMARSFERMLFLTATPFQLGHQELVRVLERFGDVRWNDDAYGARDMFTQRMGELERSLTDSQRTVIALQRSWVRLRPEEGPSNGNPDAWWQRLIDTSAVDLTPRLRALVETFAQAQQKRVDAESQLRPWVIRHNKGERWAGTDVMRRHRVDGKAIHEDESSIDEGLDVPPTQLLPFFLAARSAASPGKDLLGDALCSSYEAFRYTRQNRQADRDELDDEPRATDLTHSRWYLAEFDRALERCSGNIHPKVAATVLRAVDLWEAGEKVLVFAFYRQTCAALRLHISDEIDRRIKTHMKRQFAGAGSPIKDEEVDGIIESIQKRYFDDRKTKGRQALDRGLAAIIDRRRADLDRAGVSDEERSQLIDVMRRFLRVPTTLVRSFPTHKHRDLAPHLAVRSMLDSQDVSGLSWRDKFDAFIEFLVKRCSSPERADYLQAAGRIQPGGVRAEAEDQGDDGEYAKTGRITLANVRVATGKTRRDTRSRLMRAFNTPFFPDILVCSQVMGEGVDLQRFCRHVIHHDLAWNPSSIEQRTGRIDRLGCKAEGRHPIVVYLPYLAGAADERQYRVMRDREQWFRIVMGQDEVARLIPEDAEQGLPSLPTAFSTDMVFNLAVCGDDR